MMFSGCFLPYFSNAFAFTDINFAAVGDFGCPVSSSSNQWKTINNIKSRNAERVLGLGDYSYLEVGNADCWINFMRNSGLDLSRLKQTIGNHEDDQSGKLADFVNEFKPSPPSTSVQYYSFNYQRETGGPKIHVLVMATEQCWSAPSCSQYKFVDNDLKVASQDPSIQWIIVDYHKVMYISPNKCGSSSCVGSSSLRSTYNPLFDKYGVDIVLQGHVHNYERSKLIKYSGGSSPTIVQSSTTTYTKPSLRSPGEIFATVGTGGINFHGFSGKSSFVAFQKPSSDATFGILDLLVTDNGKTLQGKYINNGGSVKDQFTITKPVSISSIDISTANKANLTNQTSPQIIIDQLPSNQTGRNNQTAESRENITSNDRKNIKVPDLSQIINNSRRSENNVVDASKDRKDIVVPNLQQIINKSRTSQNTDTKVNNNQKDNNTNAADNEDTNLAVKPVLPKETKKDVKPVVKNIQPMANAGKNQITVEGSQVFLDGSESKDRDGKIESYHWQQVTGPLIALDNVNAIKLSFISPAVDQDTMLAFKLTVKDDNDGSDSAITAVKIANNEKEAPTVSSNVPDTTPSNPEDNSVNAERANNSTLD